MVLISWSSSGYTPVGPDCHDALSSPCLLITTWQLVKAHGVTRNEPKIHVMCYITVILRCLSFWCDFCCNTCFWEVLSIFWGTRFKSFFHFRLFDGVRFQYSQVLVIFLPFKYSDSFLMWQLYSFCFTHFSYKYDTFSNYIPLYWLYIPMVCISVFSYCPFLANILITSIKEFIFPCDLVILSSPVHFLRI